MTDSTSDRLKKKRLERVRRTVELADLMNVMTQKKAQPEIEETNPDNKREMHVGPIMPYAKKADIHVDSSPLSVQEKEWYIQIRVRKMRKRLLKEGKIRKELQMERVKMMEMSMMPVKEFEEMRVGQKEARKNQTPEQVEAKEHRRVIKYGTSGALCAIGNKGKGDGNQVSKLNASFEYFQTAYQQYLKKYPLDQARLVKLERISFLQQLDSLSNHQSQSSILPHGLNTLSLYHRLSSIQQDKPPDKYELPPSPKSALRDPHNLRIPVPDYVEDRKIEIYRAEGVLDFDKAPLIPNPEDSSFLNQNKLRPSTCWIYERLDSLNQIDEHFQEILNQLNKKDQTTERLKGREAFLKNMERTLGRLWRMIKNRITYVYMHDEGNEYTEYKTNNADVQSGKENEKFNDKKETPSLDRPTGKKGRFSRCLHRLRGMFTCGSSKKSSL